MTGHTRFEGYEAVRRAVAAFRRRRCLLRLAREAGIRVAFALGLLLAWAGIDWLLPLPALAAAALLAVAGLTAAAGAVWWLVKVLRRNEPFHREAVLIESLHGRLDNSLIGTLQLVEEVRAGRSARAEQIAPFVEALAAQAGEQAHREDFRRLLDARPAWRAAAAAAALAVATGLIALLAHGFVAGRIASVRGGCRAFLEILYPVRLAVAPGDRTLLRGEEGVTLELEVTGGAYSRAKLTAADASGATLLEADLPLAPAGQSSRRAARKELPPEWLAAVPETSPGNRSFTYRFAVGDHLSRSHTIRVVERPRVENISAELHFPAYTQLMPQQLTGMFGSIRVLEETAVTLSLAASKPLLRAALVFDNDDRTAQPFDVTGRFAATQFVVKTASEARIDLVCVDGYTMSQPVRFRIEPVPDAPPEVQVLMKKEELMLLKDEVKSFSFAWTASDDFGVGQVQVFYEVEPVDRTLGREKRSGELKPITFPRPEQKLRDVMTKPFADLEVRPGDRVTFWLVASDNNTKTGPSTGRSASHSFVVVLPSLAGYHQPEFDWAMRRSLLLGSLTKVRRNTDFLKLPDKQVTAEKTVAATKHKLAAHVPSENWPAGVENAVTDYLRLLSTHGAAE